MAKPAFLPQWAGFRPLNEDELMGPGMVLVYIKGHGSYDHPDKGYTPRADADYMGRPIGRMWSNVFSPDYWGYVRGKSGPIRYPLSKHYSQALPLP